MKKTILFLLISVILNSAVSAQKLLDIYKNGPVKLVADKSYGTKNNWETLFNLYYDTITKDVGREWNKQIVIAPDGSVFMSHKNRHEIWKFGPDGNFIKKFGSKGSKQGQFVYMPTVHPVVENKYVFTSDVGGRLNFFDLNGNYIKTINLKYMGLEFQPVGNDNILLLGYTGWKTKSRHMVVRLNITSGNEVILYDYFIDYQKQISVYDVDSLINTKKGNFSFHIPGGFNSVSYRGFIFLTEGKFIRSDSKSGEYTVFNPDGKQLIKSRMEIEPVKINEADVQVYYEMMKKTFVESIKTSKELIDPNSPMRKHNPDWSPAHIEKNIETSQKWLDNIDIYKDIKNYYPYFPYYSNIITDDEGNLLVFEYMNTDQKESNKFNVIAFDANGQKLARTSFVCDDYDLSFSGSTFVISKGYVYAVAKLKNATGMPLRLVRFKITN
jgi:hypothetical protein